MQYKCDKCSKEFNQKSHYIVHINRKFSCVPIIQTINEHNIIIPQNNAISAELNAKKRRNCVKKSGKICNDLQINEQHNNEKNLLIQEHVCKYCNKTYARKDILTRHLKNGCKSQFAFNINYDILVEENNLLKEKLDKFEKIINEKLPNKNIIIKNNTNYNTTNTNNGQIYNNTNNINIKMVNFGDEDIKKLTEDEIISILTSKSKVFINLIKAIHLNERLPEYNNLLINNLRSDYCSVIEDNKLVIKNKNKTLTELIEIRLSDLKDLINQYKTNKRLPKKDLEVLASVLEFLKTINLEDEDIDGNIIRPEKSTLKNIKELYKELTYIFYDNRDSIIKNINKVSEEEMIAYLDV
jgi:hypothetical protein